MSTDEEKTEELLARYQQAGFRDYTAIQIRLDTSPVLRDIERMLSGKHSFPVTDAEGNVVLQTIQYGKAKANDIGIQSILQYLTALFNAQVVQGNLKEDVYIDLIIQIRKDVAVYIVINKIDFGILSKDLNSIIDCIMNTVELYLSRTIDNKERESYTHTMKSHETNTVRAQNEGWSLNPFKKR